jgi:hypothetical protein
LGGRGKGIKEFKASLSYIERPCLKINKVGVGGPCCNPSYSGGRDQESQGWKPALANNSEDPISKIPNTKKVLAE